MNIIRAEDFDRLKSKLPKDYVDLIESKGVTVNGVITLSDIETVLKSAAIPAVTKPCSPISRKPSEKIPREKWPLWAKALALLAKDSDVGLGDVIDRTIGPIGGQAFKKWYEKIFRKSCGCGARRDSWNLRWSLR